MARFDESIKRNLTRGKFENIRNEVYDTTENLGGYTYGHVASWLTWNRNGNGEIESAPPPLPILTRNGAFYDGPISSWDNESQEPSETGFSSKLTTNIVFVGLNMSGEMEPDTSFTFQNARGHPFIVQTFFNTQAEGGYFTDIIKPDRRITDHLRGTRGRASESEKIIKYLEANEKIREEHIRIFKKELDFIGAGKNTLIVIFGNDACYYIKEGIKKNILNEFDYYAIIKIWHYTYRYTTLVKYINDTRAKLLRYITIPSPIEAICGIKDLNAGDYIVDNKECIGQFIGNETRGNEEYLKIKYSNDEVVRLPANRINLIKRFTGKKGLPLPPLDKFKTQQDFIQTAGNTPNKELDELKNLLQSKGIEMAGPNIINEQNNKTVREYNISKKINDSLDLVISIFPKNPEGKQFTVKYFSGNLEGAKKIRDRYENIRNIYPDIILEPSEKTLKWANIWRNVNALKDDSLEFIQKTRTFFEY